MQVKLEGKTARTGSSTLQSQVSPGQQWSILSDMDAAARKLATALDSEHTLMKVSVAPHGEMEAA